MAKGGYFGVADVARKLTKGYFSPDGTARKIIKAYMGVGGVARPCWSADGPSLINYGSISQMNVRRYGLTGAAAGNCAYFAGGTNFELASYAYINEVDVYNGLTKLTSRSISPGRKYIESAETSNYAYFVGGYNPSSIGSTTLFSSAIDVFNTSGTRTVGRTMSGGLCVPGVTAVGNIIVIAGGMIDSDEDYSEKVYVMDGTSAPTQLSETYNLSTARAAILGETLDSYAIFVGGTASGIDVYRFNSTSATDVTKIANVPSLSKTVSASFVSRGASAVTGASETNEKCALFKGGSSRSILAINNSLTEISLTAQAYASAGTAATTLDENVLFIGGDSGKMVDMFDPSLTHSRQSVLNYIRDETAAVTVSGKVLVAGGIDQSLSGDARVLNDVQAIYLQKNDE